ncbi:hypothetical protein BpHYR1_026048 [Brachionus plicatilis]|uniref:Uncharacterized protein n=1 Tax=Brachionus plicatilis TaxID=10195 RepID=A0A3M7T0E7_BRAPC|nr:hypothetical protein BpHYR1_026048 [Brachionus plicatilis]
MSCAKFLLAINYFSKLFLCAIIILDSFLSNLVAAPFVHTALNFNKKHTSKWIWAWNMFID